MKTFTVNDAAVKFKRTTARIRQICIEHTIGETIEGRIRILSPADFREIGRIIAASENRLLENSGK